MIRTKWLMYAPEGAGTAVSGGDAGAVQESPGVPGRTQSPAPEAEAEPSAAGGPAAPPGEAAAPAAQDAEEGRNEALPQETEAPAPLSGEADPALCAHFLRMEREARALRELLPDFRLEEALQDPRFVRFTSPEGGLSVRQAVWALCGDALQAQTVSALAERIRLDAARALRAGSRPRENGGSAAPVAACPDLRHMSRDQRRAYIRQKYGAEE